MSTMKHPDDGRPPSGRVKVKAVQHEPGPLARAARLRTDAARHAYMRVRRLLTAPWHRARSREAEAIHPRLFSIDREAGFLIQPPNTIAHVNDVVIESQRSLDAFLSRPEGIATGRKSFLLNVLDRDALTLDSPFVRLALQPDVLAAVSRYLGVVPLLTTIQVFYSDVMTKAPQSSQLFHCDGDDVEQVKLFVLCSDVDASGGPLTLLTAADSERVRKSTGYQYRQRLKDKQVRRAGGGQGTPVVGPPGTTVLVDTSRCFHFGSRVAAEARPRLVAMIQYQTPYSFMLPVNANLVAPFRHLSGGALSRVQRMVLGAV
jgi:hypothetical protein